MPTISSCFLAVAFLALSTLSSIAAASLSNRNTLSIMAPKVKLTYFDIEGRGEPVRLALSLADVPYEDERIRFPEWSELKPKAPYGQLPLLTVDDGPMRGQSGAMLRWIGTELCTSLYPKERLWDVEEALGVIDDLATARAPCIYVNMRPENFGHASEWNKSEEGQRVVKALREKFVSDQLPKFMGYLTALLEKNNHQWLASTDAPTIADCVAVPLLRSFTVGFIDHIPTDCLDAYPAIRDYVKRFCALPQIDGRYEKGLH